MLTQQRWRQIIWTIVVIVGLGSFGTLFLAGLDHYQECQEGYAREQTANHRTDSGEVGYSCALRAVGESADSFAILLTALATISLVFYTLKLGDEGRRQAELSRRQIKVGIAAARAAQDAALATRDSVETMERNAQRELRAYVFLTPDSEMRAVASLSTESPVEIEINVSNLGKTPAYEALCHSWVDVQPWPMPEGHTFTGPPDPGPINRCIIPPGGTIHLHTGTSRPLDAQTLRAVKSGALRLYIYGSISYRDAFGHDRYTNFCFASTIAGMLGYKSAIARCDRHNDAN